MNYRRKAMGGLIFGVCAAVPMLAAQVDIPNTFSAGEPARASQVNANFTTLTSAVEQLQNTVSELQSQLEDKEDRITALEDSALFEREDFVVNLDNYLDIHESSLEDTAVQGPVIRMTGVNLQLLNQARDTGVADGTGNLILGLAKSRDLSGGSADPVCSDGQYLEQSTCESAGELWQIAHNSGSHNLVVGRRPAYSSNLGIVGGSDNAVTGPYTVALGGAFNIAGSDGAAAIGGIRNVAGDRGAATLGGRSNSAGGQNSTIIGGDGNTTEALVSLITGGSDNTVASSFSTVSGGYGCQIEDTAPPYAWGALDAGGSAPFGDC